MRFSALFIAFFAVVPFTAIAVEVPALPEMQPKHGGGLILTVTGADKTVDVRHARMASLYVPEGTSITPFVAPGPFKAVWTGDLNIKLRDEFTFLAEGTGKLTIQIGAETVLEASGNDFSQAQGKVIKLMKGKNKLTVTYESPEKGDAFLRTFWKGAEFLKEPLPIGQLTHDTSIKEIREGTRLREGRELFAELRCSRCHGADGVPAPGSVKAGEASLSAMPELEMDAPDLADAGARLKLPWVTQWLKDPRVLRPDSSMPQVLHGETSAKDALDIAGYLGTLGQPDMAATVMPDEKVIQQGGGLIEKLGCVSCHTMPDNPKIEEGRVPLRYVRAKWNEPALRAFLKQPDKHYKWIRMPNFNFSDEEIAKVSAFLMHSKIEDMNTWLVFEVKDKPDAARGKTLFASAGCVNCHSVGANVASTLKSPPLKIAEVPGDGWTKGCMAPKPDARGKAPEFHLTDKERGALLAFAANTGAKKSMNADSMPEFAERQLRVLRCVACHQRDDQDDLWSKLEEETASLKVEEEHADGAENVTEVHMVAQTRPKLTWIGEKLKPEWMGDFIAGKIPYKFRPWIHARMPGFQQRAPLIARGLAIEHGFKPVTPQEPAPAKEMSDVGKKIVVKEGGFACTGCHGIGKTAAVGVFEAPGPNLMYTKSRLQKSYFMRWMKNPLRVDPDTKMPEFAPGDTNQLTQFYEGHTAKQFEAIWQYLLAGENIEAPEE